MLWKPDPRLGDSTTRLYLENDKQWPVADVCQVPGATGWCCVIDVHLPPSRRRSATAATEGQAQRWAWVWAHRNLSRLAVEVQIRGRPYWLRSG